MFRRRKTLRGGGNTITRQKTHKVVPIVYARPYDENLFIFFQQNEMPHMDIEDVICLWDDVSKFVRLLLSGDVAVPSGFRESQREIDEMLAHGNLMRDAPDYVLDKIVSFWRLYIA